MTYEQFLQSISKYSHQYKDLQQGTKSAWFECFSMRAYMRVGRYFLGSDGFAQCLVVSNVCVYAEYQGQKKYAMFLEDMHKLCIELGLVLVVENVLSKEHHKIYLSRGFKSLATSQVSELGDYCPVTFLKTVDH